MPAAALLLISSFLHAFWNTLLKNEPKKSLVLFHSVTIATILAWIILIFFHGINYGNALPLTLISGVVEGLYFISLTYALSNASLAISYSVMRALSMLITWILSAIFLNETLGLWSAVGVAFILIGLIIPLIQKKSKGTHKLFWSYICALTITAYNFIYNRAMHLGADPLTLFATSLLITLPFLYFSLNRVDRKNNLQNLKLPTSLIIGAIILASFSFFLYGLKETLPAIALTIRNASIPFALILSHFLGEKINKSEVLVLIFIIIGVFIVSTVTLYS